MSSELKHLRKTEFLRALKFSSTEITTKNFYGKKKYFFESSAAIINKKISFSVDVMIKISNVRQQRAFSSCVQKKNKKCFVP